MALFVLEFSRSLTRACTRPPKNRAAGDAQVVRLRYNWARCEKIGMRYRKTIFQRYRQLNLWSRIGLWGSLASIIGFLAFLLRPQTQVPPAPPTSTVAPSPGATVLQSGRDIVINPRAARSTSTEPDADQQTPVPTGRAARKAKETAPKVSVSDSPGAVVQSMKDSPGGVQIGGDLHINNDRRLTGEIANGLVASLRGKACHIRVGVLGLGDEPDRLANDVLAIAQRAGCQAEGVFHGVGFDPFDGIRLKYSPDHTPTDTVKAVAAAFNAAKLLFVAGPDPSQPPGAIYIFVGYKPE